MKLDLPVVNSDRFTYDKLGKVFVVEDSEFNMNLNVKRLYDDACDLGFVMVSSKTGKMATFVLEHEVVSPAESEVMAWRFTPSSETLRKLPELKDHSVMVFND